MIRPLTAGDIPQALALSAAAGWNQTSDDWRMLIELDPESCFAFECEGELAATATLVCYERRLGWLGMVLTKAPYRRRGFARALVERALQLADLRGIDTVKLDATDQGRPLYESLGFVPEQEIERWWGDGRRSPPAQVEPVRFPEAVNGPDLSAFSANRSRLLALLGLRAEPLIAPGGCLFQRPGRTASYIGPFLARTPEIAKRLLDQCLNENQGPWLWDLLPANENAAALATKSGFRLQRKLVRMYRGAKLRGQEEIIFAIAGLELG